MRAKFVEIAKNKAGTTLGLARLSNGSFGVYILRGNYCSRAQGGVSYSWCYCAKNLEENSAKELFQRKLNSKAR